MKKLLSVLLLAVAPALVLAQANQGYLVDTNNNIVKSGTGLCWRTGYWTPANAVEGCDPVAKTGVPTASKVTLNADMLFAFNKATLTPEGRKILDGVVKSSQGVTLEVVAVTGYTDRIGSDKYNLKLSQERAASVRQYLVQQGVPADKIVTEGRGKANPVTGDTCKGAVTKKLIACLQPDRRAILEIIGSK